MLASHHATWMHGSKFIYTISSMLLSIMMYWRMHISASPASLSSSTVLLRYVLRRPMCNEEKQHSTSHIVAGSTVNC